jgi:group I intron endonuclease
MKKNNLQNYLAPLLDTPSVPSLLDTPSSIPVSPSPIVPISPTASPKKTEFCPIKTYSNAEADKAQILSDNLNKSGIYMWKNLQNDKRYIGSSNNLRVRFLKYFNTNSLRKKKYMAICCAILKHGYSNFSLTIIEYCEAEQCLEREDFYLSSWKPEYNINPKATAPFSGRKHSDETKIIMSDAKKGENNPNYGKTRNHTEETKTIMSDAHKGKTHSDKTKTKISDALTGEKNPMHNKPKPQGAGKPSQAIEVIDNKTNEKITYNSMDEAARALNLPSYRIISNYILRNQKKPYKKRFTFTIKVN